MNTTNCVILSFSPQGLCERLENGEKTIKGTWLFELVKNELNIESKLFFIGRDNLKRVEIGCHIVLFNKLRVMPVFIMQCEYLRRARSSNERTLLDKLVIPMAEFDNDLDN